jgi:hypothetical protein
LHPQHFRAGLSYFVPDGTDGALPSDGCAEVADFLVQDFCAKVTLLQKGK